SNCVCLLIGTVGEETTRRRRSERRALTFTHRDGVGDATRVRGEFVGLLLCRERCPYCHQRRDSRSCPGTRNRDDGAPHLGVQPRPLGLRPEWTVLGPRSSRGDAQSFCNWRIAIDTDRRSAPPRSVVHRRMVGIGLFDPCRESFFTRGSTNSVAQLVLASCLGSNNSWSCHKSAGQVNQKAG